MPTSCSHYFQQALIGAQRCGLDVDAVMADTSLRRDQVQDPRWRGNVSQLAKLVETVVAVLGDEFMGYASMRSKPGTFAMMTNCMIYESSLEQAMRKGILFYTLFTDAIAMSLTEDDREATWTVHLADPALDPAHYFIEFWLSIWYRLLAWLVGQTPRLTAVDLDYPADPDSRDELALLFGITPTFDAPTTALRFEASSLRLPVVRSRQDLKAFLATTPLGVMTTPASDDDVARKVRQIIRVGGREPVKFPSLREVAAQLYLTEQTLRRRLQAENTSFREIKKDIRRSVAEKLLIETNLPVHDISDMAGYAEPRSFVRAFQEWTGISPTGFRRRAKPPTSRSLAYYSSRAC